MLITKEYQTLNAELHRTNRNYGCSGFRWAKNVRELAQAMNTRDILDYGCGKSTLAQNLPFNIKQYDPAIQRFSEPPKPADLVICTDVLEHIEPDCIEAVLDDLQRVIKLGGFVTIATRPAKKFLSDGRNAHLIQEGIEWWVPRLASRFRITNLSDTGNELVVYLEAKSHAGQ